MESIRTITGYAGVTHTVTEEMYSAFFTDWQNWYIALRDNECRHISGERKGKWLNIVTGDTCNSDAELKDIIKTNPYKLGHSIL